MSRDDDELTGPHVMGTDYLLGQLVGEVRGLGQRMDGMGANLNLRVDELAKGLNQRIDSMATRCPLHEDRLTKIERKLGTGTGFPAVPGDPKAPPNPNQSSPRNDEVITAKDLIDILAARDTAEQKRRSDAADRRQRLEDARLRRTKLWAGVLGTLLTILSGTTAFRSCVGEQATAAIAKSVKDLQQKQKQKVVVLPQPMPVIIKPDAEQ